MDNGTEVEKQKSLQFTEDMKFISNKVNLGIIIFAMIVLAIYCGLLSYSIWVNLNENNNCKTKPSATDASFTCPNQNGNPNLSSTSKDNYAPYYLSDTGEKIPVTTFYGAIDNFS